MSFRIYFEIIFFLYVLSHLFVIHFGFYAYRSDDQVNSGSIKFRIRFFFGQILSICTQNPLAKCWKKILLICVFTEIVTRIQFSFYYVISLKNNGSFVSFGQTKKQKNWSDQNFFKFSNFHFSSVATKKRNIILFFYIY